MCSLRYLLHVLAFTDYRCFIWTAAFFFPPLNEMVMIRQPKIFFHLILPSPFFYYKSTYRSHFLDLRLHVSMNVWRTCQLISAPGNLLLYFASLLRNFRMLWGWYFSCLINFCVFLSTTELNNSVDYNSLGLGANWPLALSFYGAQDYLSKFYLNSKIRTTPTGNHPSFSQFQWNLAWKSLWGGYT